MKFQIEAQDGAARRGCLSFRRGNVQTPAFMPVGTYGTVKSVTPEEVVASGAEIVLELWGYRAISSLGNG